MILNIFLVYTAFGIFNLLINLFFFNVGHILYARKTGTIKIKGVTYDVLQRDPLYLQVITTIVVIYVWPYFIHLMVSNNRKPKDESK
jgi:hypothetical protein